jgi:hypothetical protein
MTRLLLLIVLAWPLGASALTATLGWQANPEPDLKGYKIYRGVLPCAAVGPMAPLATVGKVTSYVDTTIPATAPVVAYRIAAVDLAGNESPLSVCVEKAEDAPAAPAATVN